MDIFVIVSPLMPNRTSSHGPKKRRMKCFDLRFSVIADRFSSSRTMEELKNRYYSVSRTILIDLYYKDWRQNPNFDNGGIPKILLPIQREKTSRPQKDSQRKPDGISREVCLFAYRWCGASYAFIDANQLKKHQQPENEKCRDDGLKFPTCNAFVLNCPNITTLALKGFKLHDYKAHMLVKGLQKLKHIDLSTSYSFTGSFLKSIGAVNTIVRRPTDGKLIGYNTDCQHEVLTSGPIEDLIAHREHQYHKEQADRSQANRENLKENISSSQTRDDRSGRGQPTVDIAEVLRRWTQALQRIHKQSLHLAKENGGEGPDLLRSASDGSTSGHAESLATTLSEHRQHLASIQVLVNQLKGVAPTIQNSISELSEEVNTISTSLPQMTNHHEVLIYGVQAAF
ncbi:hypothetical protein Lser_V15G12855 [Lactuca serriola]